MFYFNLRSSPSVNLKGVSRLIGSLTLLSVTLQLPAAF